MEKSGVDNLERVHNLDGFLATLICRSGGAAGFHAVAGQPHHLAFCFVIGAELHAAAADAVVG